ncbi:N-acetylmuramoyl-L-alanine amidase [Saccharopolyspora rhizosphaerae]|uniref:N-acetylmuramoyl-L-alanine amidase n=1 Tax=Saccharopolyspora rhizosphaerae TaxID=2492662 RepID=A0A3R8P8V5_9PSEU|nr:N-acetylmuramoyl-L-alanine amidase [Saccharopolyspora rhizosphaerae]RRO19244.1 N-acetylmuramoyl-L-alanine amidase [Saccharopolyspora rhizosphaerae]
MALPLVWLADVLRAAGLNVVETPGWKERTASGEQPAAAVGVLEHHTATPASYDNPAPSVQLCIDGRPDLKGPLCHAVIGFDGVVHLIAAGRANHAGEAKPSGPNPGGDGNTLYVGFEWDYQGVDQGPSPEQHGAALTATAAVLRHLGRPPDAARGHKETSVTGKIDPGHVDMDRFRADLVTKEQEDEMTPEQDAILRRLEHELLGPRGPQGEIQGWKTAVGPRTIVAMLVDLVNNMAATQQQNAGGGGLQGAEAIKAAFEAMPADQAAPLLAELVRVQQQRQPAPGA